MATTRRTRCVVVGAGGHARAVIAVLMDAQNQRRYEIAGVVESFCTPVPGENILGIPVLSKFEDVQEPEDCRTAFLAVGDNRKRKALYREWGERGFALPNLASFSAVISSESSIGRGNFFAPFVHVGPAASIGENNIFNTRANIEHDVTVGNHNHVAPGAVMLGGVNVGDDCLIGTQSAILEKRRISSCTTVGAGAVITRDILEPGLVLVGIPGRVRR